MGWVVTNQGAGPTDVDVWTDAVILSDDEILGDADDRVIGTRQRSGVLGAGVDYLATL